MTRNTFVIINSREDGYLFDHDGLMTGVSHIRDMRGTAHRLWDYLVKRMPEGFIFRLCRLALEYSFGEETGLREYLAADPRFKHLAQPVIHS